MVQDGGSFQLSIGKCTWYVDCGRVHTVLQRRLFIVPPTDQRQRITGTGVTVIGLDISACYEKISDVRHAWAPPWEQGTSMSIVDVNCVRLHSGTAKVKGEAEAARRCKLHPQQFL